MWQQWAHFKRLPESGSGCWASQRAWWLSCSWGISRVRYSPGEPLDSRTTANHWSAYAHRNKWTGILWYHGRQCHSWSHTRESTGQGPPYGGSNCRGLEPQGEDSLDLAVTPLIQGGLLIEEAAEKLDECSKELKSETDIVVVHVGSCNFPANDFTDIDRHYTHYVELLNTITNNCPKANIVVSNVLPRNGHQNTNINDQIKTFNRKRAELAWTEEKIQFSDNFGHFEGENDEVDRNLFKTSDRSGVHLNVDGQGRLATALVHCVKEAFFKRKLEAELEIAPPPPY